MLIGVDLDGVIADFLGSFIAYHNHHYRTAYRKEDFAAHPMELTIGGSQEEIIRKTYEFYGSTAFGDLKPILGSQEALKELGRLHKLIIITARPKDIANQTQVWLQEHFPTLFADIIHAQDHFVKGIGFKSRICLERGVNILVDDAAENAQEFLEHPTRFILFDQPWNRSFDLSSGMSRVKNWHEVVEKIKSF